VVPSALVDRARGVIGSAATVVAGGDTRQQSVANGLARISADTVVVHDAARPLLTPGLVERVVAALEDVDGAIAAVPVGETVKRAEAGYVTATIDRSALWLAQTPQAFRTEVLAAAHERASAEGFESTDDAQLVERYGGRVAVVESSPANLKITYAEDFEVAEAVLAGRRS
jgi:2-C-methyl-D-erythritol 4-phosphate cytidylyltransferase